MPQSLTSKQQYWTEVLESADSSGLPLVEFARANQLNPKTLYRWRNQLKKYSDPTDQTKTHFTQVAATSFSAAPTLSVNISHARLHFDQLPDADWLARLLTHSGQAV